MKIKGVDHLSLADIEAELAGGARFICYPYCISLLLVTFRAHSSIVFLRPSQRGFVQGVPFTLLTLLLGWWGLPWGPIYSISAIFTNLAGGHDMTPTMRVALREMTASAE